MPRICNVLENTQNLEVRIKALETIKQLQEAIDVATLKASIFKSFDKLRTRDNDPQVSMLMLHIYKNASDSLSLDEIGIQLLPGIIPMLVSSNISRD